MIAKYSYRIFPNYVNRGELEEQINRWGSAGFRVCAVIPANAHAGILDDDAVTRVVMEKREDIDLIEYLHESGKLQSDTPALYREALEAESHKAISGELIALRGSDE